MIYEPKGTEAGFSNLGSLPAAEKWAASCILQAAYKMQEAALLLQEGSQKLLKSPSAPLSS